MSLVLTDIARYPVKSCRGDHLVEAVVEPWGLVDDRRWMLVDPSGSFITAREDPELVLVHPVVVEGGLRVTAPGRPPIDVPRPDPDSQIDVEVWKSRITAATVAPTVDRWFSDVLGRPVRLVYLDDPTRRGVDPEFGRAADRVSFADGYPLLVTTEASLDALNTEIARRGIGEEVTMTRFRPNLVVAGGSAWAEDDWRRITIGGIGFRAVKGCARCVLTTVNPDTAAKGKEPLASLATLRRFGKGLWFGVNLVPDVNRGERPVVRIGDPVRVDVAVPSGGGPLRAMS